MKIHIGRNGSKDVCLALPNAMLFSPALLNLVLRLTSRSGRQLPQIPPAAVNRLCNAVNRFSRENGPWELVRVDTADGSTVIITV